MIIQSPEFEHHQPIPKKYTCQGEDLSPPLSFGEIPSEAKSLVLIVDDPDAPHGTFDHWIVWNLEPRLSGLVTGVKLDPSQQGRNGFNQMIYRGPCPPPGRPHRYFFKLYALDKRLQLPQGADKKTVEEAMKGHILDHAELVGTYQKS